MILVMKEWSKNKPGVVFFFVVWFILSISFIGNFFGTGLWNGWFDGFQKDSSAIVEKTAYCKNKYDYKGPLIAADSKDYNKIMMSQDCNPSQVKPYVSQYGLQARVITGLSPNDASKIPAYIKRVSIFLAALTAFLLALVVQKIRALFGGITASVFVVMLAFSPWIAGYARNIYWIEPLLIAPFVISFVGYQYFKKSKKLWLFYIIESVAMFLKLLNGYEYVSTIAISVLVPIIFFELVHKNVKIINLWKQAVPVFTATVVAFFGAYWVNFMSLTDYYGSSDKAANAINARASDRGISGIRSMRAYAVGNFKILRPETYNFINQIVNLDNMANNSGKTYKYIIVNVVNYLLLPAITLPVHINGMFGEFIQSILFWTILGYLIIFSSRKIIDKKYSRPFLWSMNFSVIGAFCWLALMPGHALPHAHINGIIFYIPLLLFVYILIGLWADYVVKRTVKYE